MKNLDSDFLERAWYSFCTEDEIDRLLSPKTPMDFLLKKRAEIVSVETRYYRVYLAQQNRQKNWSFEHSFETRHYSDFLSSLSPENKLKCDSICFGDIFEKDVNAFAWYDNNFGSFASLHYGIKYFMNFCNLALLDFDIEVPEYIRTNSLRIAIRIFLGHEAMDFLLDPRGIIPKKIYVKLMELQKYEKQYVVGHEFSHHLLGHLDKGTLKNRAFLHGENNDYFANIFTPQQTEELAADIASINYCICNEKEYEKLYNAAIIWFFSLEICDIVDSFYVNKPNYMRTHPFAKDRRNYFMENVRKPPKLNLKCHDRLSERITLLKPFILEELAMNTDFYEMYGSAYLDKPNTQWRGKELIDRVDY